MKTCSDLLSDPTSKCETETVLVCGDGCVWGPLAHRDTQCKECLNTTLVRLETDVFSHLHLLFRTNTANAAKLALHRTVLIN